MSSTSSRSHRIMSFRPEDGSENIHLMAAADREPDYSTEDEPDLFSLEMPLIVGGGRMVKCLQEPAPEDEDLSDQFGEVISTIRRPTRRPRGTGLSLNPGRAAGHNGPVTVWKA